MKPPVTAAARRVPSADDATAVQLVAGALFVEKVAPELVEV